MKKVKISNLGEKSNRDYFIIAETAFSHEGSVDYLKSQIDDAAKGQANGVKFQLLFDVNESYAPNTEIFENFHKWQISQKSWIDVIEYTKSKNLQVIVLPIDSKSLDFVSKNVRKIDAIEIHSICFNQITFIEKLKNLTVDLILGVGGRNSDDIDFLFNKLNLSASNKKREVILMYGFQSFPTNYEKLNLSKLIALKNRYGCILGYADHTSYTEIETGHEIMKYAYLCGARVFEKHLVIEKGSKRIDYEAAVGYEDFIKLRKDLDKLIKILGSDDLSKLNDVELKYRNREKQIIAMVDIKAGEKFSYNNIGYKVSPSRSDFEQKSFIDLIGKESVKDIKKNEVIKEEYIRF
jgi:sialic acid synthase SpsE